MASFHWITFLVECITAYKKPGGFAPDISMRKSKLDYPNQVKVIKTIAECALPAKTSQQIVYNPGGFRCKRKRDLISNNLKSKGMPAYLSGNIIFTERCHFFLHCLITSYRHRTSSSVTEARYFLLPVYRQNPNENPAVIYFFIAGDSIFWIITKYTFKV